MSDYNSVKQSTIDQLIEICGANFVIYNDPDKLQTYSHDEVAESLRS